MLNAFKLELAGAVGHPDPRVMPSDRRRPAARPANRPGPVSALLVSLIAVSLPAPLIGAMLTAGHVGPLFIVDWTPTMTWIDWSATAAIALALLTIAEGARDRTSHGWARAARTAARAVRTVTIVYASLIWVAFLVLLIGFGAVALLALPAPILTLLNLTALPLTTRIRARTDWAAR